MFEEFVLILKLIHDDMLLAFNDSEMISGRSIFNFSFLPSN
jgi:hypothetical protein